MFCPQLFLKPAQMFVEWLAGGGFYLHQQPWLVIAADEEIDFFLVFGAQVVQLVIAQPVN